MEISVGSLGFLLSLADYGTPGTTADMLAERTGAEGERLVAEGLFSPGPNRTMIDVELSVGEGAALIEDDPASGGFRYLHPEDGYLPLAPWRLRTWRLDLPRLAALITHLLGMPASFRPTPLVDGLLWDLGSPRLGKKNIPVLFGVRLGESEVRTQMRRELDLRRGAPPALVLTSGRAVASDVTFPTVSRIEPVTLSAICHASGRMQVQDSEELHLIPMLADVKVQPPKNGYGESNSVRYAALEQSASAAVQRPAAQPARPAAQSRPAAAPATAPWRRNA